MPTGITIEIKADVTGFKRDVKSALDTGSQNVRQFKTALDQSNQSIQAMRRSVDGLRSALVSLASLGVLKQLAENAFKAGIELDKTRSTMVALTGSVDAANKKIVELRALSRSSPGVTQSFAQDLFVQFKALREVSDSTINGLIKSIGRLNAVFSIPDVKTFSRNLIQIFKGGFEMDQIKEAINALPIFNQLLESAFGTSDNQKLKKLRDAGKLTMQSYLDGLIGAINTDPRFKNVQETLGTRLQKSLDETRQKLAELGEKALRDLLPVLERLLPVVSGLLDRFTALPTWLQATTIGVTVLAGPIANLTTTVANLTSAIISLNAAGNAGLMARLLRGPVILTAAVGAGVAVQTYREVTGNQQMIDTIGGPDQDRIARIMKERGLSGADAFMRVAQELKDQALISGLPRPEMAPGMSAAQVYQALGTRPEATTKKKTAGPKAPKGIDLPSLTADELITTQYLGMGALARTRLTPDQMRKVTVTPLGSPGAITGQPTIAYQADIDIDRFVAGQNRFDVADQRLRLEEVRIQNQVNAGLLFEADARQRLNAVRAASRSEIIAALEDQRQAVGLNSAAGLQLTEQIEQVQMLGVELNNTQRFMRGFGSAIDAAGDAWERFGQSVSRSLTNVKDLLNGLKQSVLQLFNDLAARSIQNLVGQALAPLAGLFGGGTRQPSIAGAAGNLFRTPPTFASPTSSDDLLSFEDILRGVGGGGGSGIPAPPSITAGAGPGYPSFFTRGASDSIHEAGHTAAGALARPSFFSGLKNNLAAAAPFLGLSIGGSLGGQSIPGQILGSAGGLLTGGFIGAKAAPALFGKAAAFFTNPFTIAAGVGLLVGGVLLGRAKQRRQDEELSGQYLTQALQGIDQIAAGVASGQIAGSEARNLFESNVINPFRQQISTLKTRSVVESRLTNQVRDLRNVFEARIPPLIAEQERKAADARRFADVDSRLIPQFATGGISRGGLAFLHDREMVLTQKHQAQIAARAGQDIFRSVGVPGVQPNARFDNGGVYSSSSSSSQPLDINIQAQVVISDKTATGIYIIGATSADGRKVNIRQDRENRRNREA